MAMATKSDAGTLESPLGDDAASLLEHTCTTVGKEHLHLPGPDFVDRISGRKAFQRPMTEGIQLLNAIQDVNLNENVTVA